MATEVTDKIEEFKRLVAAHDLTFDYSDHGETWRRGCAELNAIRALAKEIPPETAAEIWNANVDAHLIEEVRKGWYWKVPETPPLEGRS